MLPFMIFGGFLILCFLFTLFFLPKTDFVVEQKSPVGFWQLLKIPEIIISVLAIFISAFNIGFIQATLEPHIRFLNLPPYQLGLMFIIAGGTFALVAPMWGKLCDKGVYSILLHAISASLIMVSFLLIGPAPFIKLNLSLTLIVISLFIHGFALGGEFITSFTGINKFSLSAGMPKNLATYGVASAIWTSPFSLGSFVGPVVGGILVDHIGYRNSTLFVVALHGALFFTCVIFILVRKLQSSDSKAAFLFNHSDETPLSVSVNLSESYGGSDTNLYQSDSSTKPSTLYNSI